MKRRFSGILVAAMAFALIAGTSTKAEAAFFAAICNDITCTGGGDLIVQDNTAGDNAGGILGFISLNFSTGGYDIVVNLSQSKPVLGSGTAPQLDLNFTATDTAGVGTDCSVATPCNVWLFASDNGFTGVGSGTLSLGGTQTGGTNTVNARAWGGTTNNTIDLTGTAPGITGNLLANSGNISLSPFTFSGGTGAVGGVSPYSLTIGINVIRTAPGTTTGDLNLTIPEPATMALFGLGLVGFGAASRRRKAKK